MKRTTIFTVLSVLGLLLVSTTAIAAGTGASTPINNQASVSYSVGGAPQTAIESSPTGNDTPGGGSNTTFVVDQKIDLLITTTNSAAVSIAPGGIAATTFTVTNEGNETQDILLSAVALGNGTDNPFAPADLTKDSFDSTAAVVFYEEDGTTAGFQAGEDILLVNDFLDQVLEDESRTVHMVITAPAAQAQGDLSVYALKGIVADGSGAGIGLAESEGSNTGAMDFLDTVFADSAGSDDTIGNYDGQHSARSAYVVNTALITISKTAAVYNSGNSLPTDTYAIPGAVVTYTINVTNTGAADATNVVIQDTIPANTVFFTTDNTLAADPTGGTITYSSNGGVDNYTYSPSFTAYSIDGNAIGYIDASVTDIRIDMGTLVGSTGNETATFKVRID